MKKISEKIKKIWRRNLFLVSLYSMKANELMMNNYVQFKCQCSCHTHHDIMHFAACCSPQEEIIVVEGVYEQEGHSGVFSRNGTKRYDLNELFPIPLTDEWFLKLGFESKEADGGAVGFYNWWENDEVSITWVGEGVFGIAECDCKPFRYVHQLQNLYFIVTGEQLNKINLENSN